MIHFATSGWRGIFAEDLTVQNVRRVADAIARHLLATRQGRRGVFVAFDTRFLSDRFAREAAEVLKDRGLSVVLSSRPLPTPVAGHAVAAGRKALGLVFTASHLPPEYGGLKVIAAGGVPAPLELTGAIERLANGPPGADAARMASGRRRGKATRRGTLKEADVLSAYAQHLKLTVRFPAIKKARLRLACDARHGAVAGCYERILSRHALSLEILHGTPHPEFGGVGADCGENQLRPLARAVRRGGLHLGMTCDGDGDRFGLVDRGGFPVPPSHFLALAADYLITERKAMGGVGRTVATTRLLDAVCARHGRPLFETPVGFRHLAGRLASGETFLAGEESGGLGLATHLPDKDGILAGLLAAEIVAVRRRPLREQIRDLLARIGPLHTRRIDYHTDASGRDRLLRRLESPPSMFGGRQVLSVDGGDGSRLVLGDGSWILFRASGTEIAVRCYLESRTLRDLETLTAAARELITKE